MNAPRKIDLGCGKNKAEGYYGVDILKTPCTDLVMDLRDPWPWPDQSVEEYRCCHVIEHFDSLERAHIVNEMYRTLIPGGKVILIAPYGLSDIYFGDPTHKWPPMSRMWFYYLNKEWRDSQAPHTNQLYRCNFQCTIGYAPHPDIQMRNAEYQQFALAWFVNSVVEIHSTMVKI